MVEFDKCDIENYGDLFDLIKKLNYNQVLEKIIKPFNVYNV